MQISDFSGTEISKYLKIEVYLTKSMIFVAKI